MRALRLNQPGRIALHAVPPPDAPGECLIRVRRAGICGTDLQMLDGYADFHGTLGHEFVGVVESAASSADARWIGRRVVGEINIGCGRCAACAAGAREHCESRTVLGIRGRDGAFAEYLTLPASNLHEVPPGVDDDAAVFVEPIAAACRILEQVTFEAGASVAVLGDGRMGMLVAQVLGTVTRALTLLGRHDDKLDVARSLGIDARRIGTSAAPGRYDVVVDVTGRPDGLRRSIDLARPRGIVVLKSTCHGESPLASWPIVVNELTLVGSRCGPFARALELIAAGKVLVEPLITRLAPLDDYRSAFDEARRSLKVVFRISDQ